MNIRAPLALLQFSIGCFALVGGWLMMTGRMDLGQAWLQRTPFQDWTLPGIALMALPGLGEMAAGAAVVLRWRPARLLAVLSGAGLLGWVLVQLLWMQVFHPVLHPLVGGIGIAIAVLGWRLPRPWRVRLRRGGGIRI